MLGVGSYGTAWSWLHELRRAMVRPGRDRLSGIVEVDESYVGGEEERGQGRYTERKAIVAVAVELKERGYGRVRLRCIPNVETATRSRRTPPMSSCRGCTASLRASSDGSSGRIRGRSVARTSTTTWTSSPSASTAAPR